MACIHKEIVIDAPAEIAWAAVRDFGAVHRRLVPGVLTDAKAEPGARVVTFANGMVLRELLVDLDDERRRLAYAATGGRATHHNASIQIVDEAGEPNRCRLIWITDLLPDAIAQPIAALVEQGAAVMKRTIEASAGF